MKNIIKLAILTVSASVILSGCGLFPAFFPDPKWAKADEEHHRRLDAQVEAYRQLLASRPDYK